MKMGDSKNGKEKNGVDRKLEEIGIADGEEERKAKDEREAAMDQEY